MRVLELNQETSPGNEDICQRPRCLKVATKRYEFQEMRDRWKIRIDLCRDHDDEETALAIAAED